MPCANPPSVYVLQTPLRYKLFNSAVASVAILILYGTVAAVALQEPAPRVTTTAPLAPVRAAPIARLEPSLSTLKARAPDVARQTLAERMASAFKHEQSMSNVELMKRWEPFIKKAARHFSVPVSWVREVMRIESGGRTMLTTNRRIVSSQGALGLMQIQPGTYAEMRAQFGLGTDAFDPHDNIFAGAAYLRLLRGRYGFPAMFEAYNDGPVNFEQRTTKGAVMPAETRNYVSAITVALGGKPPVFGVATPTNATNEASVSALVALANACAFTQPDGSALVVDCSQVTSIRAPALDVNSPQTQSIITIGSADQLVGTLVTQENPGRRDRP